MKYLQTISIFTILAANPCLGIVATSDDVEEHVPGTTFTRSDLAAVCDHLYRERTAPSTVKSADEIMGFLERARYLTHENKYYWLDRSCELLMEGLGTLQHLIFAAALEGGKYAIRNAFSEWDRVRVREGEWKAEKAARMVYDTVLLYYVRQGLESPYYYKRLREIVLAGRSVMMALFLKFGFIGLDGHRAWSLFEAVTHVEDKTEVFVRGELLLSLSKRDMVAIHAKLNPNEDERIGNDIPMWTHISDSSDYMLAKKILQVVTSRWE